MNQFTHLDSKKKSNIKNVKNKENPENLSGNGDRNFDEEFVCKIQRTDVGKIE